MKIFSKIALQLHHHR